MELSQFFQRFWYLALFFNKIFYGILANPSPQMMSVVVNKKSLEQQDHVQLVNPPSVLTDVRQLKVSYMCSKPQIVFLEIEAVIVHNLRLIKSKILSKSWKCSAGRSRRRSVNLNLDDRFLFRPDFLNKDPLIVDTNTVTIRAWILDEKLLRFAKKENDGYKRARVKIFHVSHIPPPYSRPPRTFYSSCESWRYKILKMAFTQLMLTCAIEQEVANLITYPLALNGMFYGVYRSFSTYTNEELEYKRQNLIDKPRFTISVFVYILEYCRAATLCSIVHHATWNGTYLSPLVFLTNQGKLHIQVTLSNGETAAALTSIEVPRHQWVRLALVFEEIQWKLTLNYGKDFNVTEATDYAFGSTVRLDDTEGIFYVGGSEYTPGFTGYIGQLTYYRHSAVDALQIPFPSPYHPMFELGLMRREDKCKEFISWVNRLFLGFKQTIDYRLWRDSCHPYFAKFLNRGRYFAILTDKCLWADEPPSWYHKDISRIIKEQAYNQKQFYSHQSNIVLYNRAEKLVEKGLRKVRKAVPILKQAACLGNNDAMYMLSVILNNGVAVRSDEIQAQAYLMLALLGKHRLSSLSLGHKHRNGLDGVPMDFEQAYPYYKYVADTTRQDKEKYKDTDVATESIRLTDEAQVKQQTDEDGDIFHWLKHQAQKGVLSAQQNIGRMLFWGSQGLKRNIGAALEYLRMGAESQDPQALYDYGIILLRGHGTKANKTEAMTHLKKSAEKKNPAALNALGWYALNHENNVTAAVAYFEESYRLGSPDAAFNLGILHLTGGFLDKVIDADKALTYFNFAGVRNQIDAGIHIASLNMKGTSKMGRNKYIGIEWARFIAEKNPALGLILRKAMKAYRNYDLQTAMLYYMMAGDAGADVGSFNSAYLCEGNQDGMTSLIEKDCQWRNYNVTTLRQEQFVDPYALIKMGDYYWYGCGHNRDVEKAADFYTRAAIKGDPHAIFNLGFMVEEGAHIKDSVWKKLNIPYRVRGNTESILTTLYTRCKDSRHTEAFIPCSIALYKIQLIQWWHQHEVTIQIFGFICAAIVTVLSVRSIYNHVTGHSHHVDRQIPTQL